MGGECFVETVLNLKTLKLDQHQWYEYDKNCVPFKKFKKSILFDISLYNGLANIIRLPDLVARFRGNKKDQWTTVP